MLQIYGLSNFPWRFNAQVLPKVLHTINRLFFAVVSPPSVTIGKDVLFSYSGLCVVAYCRSELDDQVSIDTNATIGGIPSHQITPVVFVAGLGIAHLPFALTAVLGLKPSGYEMDLANLARLALAAVIGALSAMLVPSLPSSWLELAAIALVSGFAFLGGVWLLSPFAPSDRQRMNQLLGRQVFHA